MNRLRPMLAVLLIACAADAGAQAVYRWIDANGRVQYTSEKPPGVPATVVQPRINSYGGTPAASGARAGGAAAAQPEVVMYATDWCPYCRQAREHFGRQRIVYREVDIEKSPAGRAEYDRLGGRGVPLILVGSQRMQGFRAESFDRLLKSAGR
jgi:glutaredoxin